MKVFIIGIAGGTGSRVAKLLANQGNAVFGLYRRPEQLESLQAIGVKGTLGDLAKISEQALASTACGADVVVFAAGAGAEDSDCMVDAVDGDGVRKTISAARLAGITRILLVSVFPEAWRERDMPKSFEHYMEVKKAAEVDLVRSGLDWVILRPSALTHDLGTGKVSLSAAEIHTHISRDDVAETIACILQTPGVCRTILEVTAGDTTIANAVSATLS